MGNVKLTEEEQVAFNMLGHYAQKLGTEMPEHDRGQELEIVGRNRFNRIKAALKGLTDSDYSSIMKKFDSYPGDLVKKAEKYVEEYEKTIGRKQYHCEKPER